MDRNALKLEIRNLINKHGGKYGGFSTVGKRKISLIISELLKSIEALEAQVAALDERTKRKPRGRPRKIREDANAL